VRDLFRKYEYTEELYGRFLVKDFVYREERNEFPTPEWWRGDVHNRVPRGAINKFTSSLNSAISNFRNGNTTKFSMKYRTKKGPTEYFNFEDKSFPTFIRKIKSRYWFTDRERKRGTVSFSELPQNRGIEVIYDKLTKKYFLHYPIERSWFPTDDRRNDSQATSGTDGDRVISLDPGVRKFMVGYDPTGSSIFVGEGASKELTKLLYEVDLTPHPRLWKKIRNNVSELHWKTASYLVKNYDVILLPHFKISQMVRGRKLARITKRLLYMFSYHSFKEKLQFKCEEYGRKLALVDESFTSCTCGSCGEITRMQGAETFKCRKCGFEADRDVSGARNILLKNITLR
jgi:IS605 OrfB family transposase